MEKVIFLDKKKNKDSLKSWGTIALIGQLTAGSEFSHITMDGGSGGNYNQINFTSMFSLHDTKNVKIKPNSVSLFFLKRKCR